MLVKRWLTPCLASLLLAATVSAEPLRLTNFEAGDTTIHWRVVNDTVMGGRSSSQVEIKNNQLFFSGQLNTNGGGFASLRSSRLEQRLSQYSTVRFRVKGDGRSYKFRLFDNDDSASYQLEFETANGAWREVELPIDEFYASRRGRRIERPTLEGGYIVALGLILADGIDGAFRLSLDWIEFVR